MSMTSLAHSSISFPERRTGALLAVVSVVAALVIPACSPDPRKEAEAIRTLIDREVEAMNGEDLTALSEIWSQDDDISLVDVPPPGRFRGWDGIARVFRDFFDRVSEVDLSVDDIQISVAGKIAYASYGWSMTGRVGERPMVDRGQATAIYRRQKDGWRLVHAHYSPVPPALALETQEPAGETPPGDTGDAAPGKTGS
jgi:uncharacterized protein (TIGR02246 family)